MTGPELRWPPVAGDEIDTLIGSLERQRRTFAWKAGGLDAAGLRVTVGASTMTLGGLLKHLAIVEEDLCSWRLHGRDPRPTWATGVDEWPTDPDWEWRTAADDTPEQLYGWWEQAVARSRASLREALADRDAGRLSPLDWNGESPNVRRLLVDLIEEYARHTGHADLIRESIDGLVGEDPPG